MFLKTVATIARFSLLFLPVVAISAADCGDSGRRRTAGGRGHRRRGGTTGSGGTTGRGDQHGRPTAAPRTARLPRRRHRRQRSSTRSRAPPRRRSAATCPARTAAARSCIPDQGTARPTMDLEQQVRRAELAHHRPGPQLLGLRPLPDVEDGRSRCSRASVRHQGHVHADRRRRRRRPGGRGHHERHRRAARGGQRPHRDAARPGGPAGPADRHRVRRHLRRRPSRSSRSPPRRRPRSCTGPT